MNKTATRIFSFGAAAMLTAMSFASLSTEPAARLRSLQSPKSSSHLPFVSNLPVLTLAAAAAATSNN